MVILEDNGNEFDQFPKAEFELSPSIADVINGGEDTIASVQVKVMTFGSLTGSEDRPRKMIEVADIPEDGEEVGVVRHIIQLYDGHCDNVAVHPGANLAIIGLSVRSQGLAAYANNSCLIPHVLRA